MRKFGLIGKSLEHSFSKSYFTEKFSRLSIDASYENLEIAEVDKIKDLFKQGFEGFNVTLPYKVAVMPFLDEISQEAKVIGAVNTICKENQKWVGYNTDVFGFRQAIKPFFKSHHERALILGTGGASKAVAYVLEQLGVNVIYASRQPKNSNTFSYADVNEYMIRFNGIIVNTTPVGTFPNTSEAPNIPYEFLNDQHLLIDLIYNPEETLFLKKGKEQGAWTMNGMTMLHQQAEASWKIWNRK